MLEEILENLEYNEILINGWQEVFAEKGNRLIKIDHAFCSKENYLQFLHSICSELDEELSLKQPFIEARWGDFRIQMVSSHINQNYPSMNLRRIRNTKWQLDDLQDFSTITANEKTFLLNLIRDKKNLLVIGPTGSGKTSLLSACLNSITASERAIILEDTDELTLPNQASTKLLTYEKEEELIQKVELKDLIRASLRMRPDRLIVGEVRSEEAKNLLLALSTGHRGSFATIHANSASEALSRLEILVQMGAPQWQVATIRKLIFYSFDYILHIAREGDSQRRLQGIFQLTSMEENGILLDPILLDFLGQHKKISG